MAKKPKLGTGKRFEQLENPAALAAVIGRKKHGAEKMAKLSAQGRKKGK